jgi:hypothetical protein
MGYLPIFLYLASFIFLFLLVVNNSIKNKKKQYHTALEDLVTKMKGHATKASGRPIAVDATLEEVELQYQTLKSSADPSDREGMAHLNQIKLTLGRVRQQQYWYNNMVKTKPYSFVAKLFGHKSL